jgi:hypothetical protein
MVGDDVPVRPLTIHDLGWVADLSERRRRDREPYAPRFWRQAANAHDVHAAFLGSLIADPDVLCVRTDRSFAFAATRPGFLLVDDAAVEDEADWAIEGPALLRAVAGAATVRFVCPVPEPARAALAASLGLRIEETWWHRDLEFVEARADIATGGAIETRGALGRLVPAPPVYAPGGPVLLVTEVADRAALADIEDRAAAAGAPVSVVTQHPDDRDRARLLYAAGYRRTCDFYHGTVR